MAPTANYYDVLGVKKDASADEIKKAFRKLAKQYHPDSTGGDKAKEAKFKVASTAYEVIGDSKRRERYDQVRGGGFSPFPSSSYENSPMADLLNTFGDLFGAPRARATERPSRPPQPQPPRPEPPPRVPRPTESPFGTRFDAHMHPESQAPTTVSASDGSSLRVDGFDVQSDVVISFDQAMLGATVTIATIDGRSEVKIPAGSSSGRKLRLRGKGVNNPNGFTGDHHVTVQIEIPGDIGDEAIDLVLKLASFFGRSEHRDGAEPCGRIRSVRAVRNSPVAIILR
jgi:molecular chaperone DnaJ